MVVPTYWGKKAGSVANEKIVFDHPTDLAEEGTLPRLLESIVRCGFQGPVVIISVANRSEICGEVEAKVDALLEPWQGSLNLKHLGASVLDRLREDLQQRGLSEAALGWLHLENYAAVRNICALAGVLLNAERTLFIDDDEIFDDPAFFEKLDWCFEQTPEGKPVEALAGYYLQPSTFYLDESRVPEWRRPYWNNTHAMNRGFEKIIGSEPRLKPTPFVFGGNMAIRLDVLKRIPFDPHITRGEDIDYLLNLLWAGVTVYMDNQLAITHRPPPGHQEPWKKVREDAWRFLYEKRKVEELGLNRDGFLDPYPGLFLKPDLKERIEETNRLLAQELEKEGDSAGAAECRKTMAMIPEKDWREFDVAGWLAAISASWQELTDALCGKGVPGDG